MLGTNEVPRPASPSVARMKVPRSMHSANAAEPGCERRTNARLAEVAREAASGRELSNDIAVSELTPPTQVEPL